MKQHQLKLIICESTTGIVLNAKLEYAISDKDINEFFFDNISELKEFVNSFGQPKNVSFEAFDTKKNLVFEKHLKP